MQYSINGKLIRINSIFNTLNINNNGLEMMLKFNLWY